MTTEHEKHSELAAAAIPAELATCATYEDIKPLGEGGMGVVYLAKNKLMDRPEVLKVVNKSLLTRAGAAERFLREIQSAARLRHPNVVAAYTVLQLGELLVFSMEYVPGNELAKLVKTRGPLPPENACYYALQVANGLQHAHEKKMIHRDIKPANLIVHVDREKKRHLVKILDFGLAKMSSEQGFDAGLTGEGLMLGTPDYIAPEQIVDAQSADIRADIYSLGCTIYFLLTGAPPFQATSLFDLLRKHREEDARPLNLLCPAVTPELAGVVSKMMAKDPARRYQTPAEVAKALAPYVVKSNKPSAKPQGDRLPNAVDPGVGKSTTLGHLGSPQEPTLIGVPLAVAPVVPAPNANLWQEATIVGSAPPAAPAPPDLDANVWQDATLMGVPPPAPLAAPAAAPPAANPNVWQDATLMGVPPGDQWESSIAMAPLDLPPPEPPPQKRPVWLWPAVAAGGPLVVLIGILAASGVFSGGEKAKTTEAVPDRSEPPVVAAEKPAPPVAKAAAATVPKAPPKAVVKSGPAVVSTWEYTNPSNVTSLLVLYSNGHFNTPDGVQTWDIKGNVLTLRWGGSNPRSPVDRCLISPDGKTFQGQNQARFKMSGKKVSDGEPVK